MLPCPRCNVALAISRQKQGIHYVCPVCHGLSVNLPLLRRTIEPAFINSLWATVRDSPPVRHHEALPCPSCKGLMHAAGVGVSPMEIQLDICRHCQIIWLDPGEMELLPAAAKPAPPVFPNAEMPPDIAEKMAPYLIARSKAQVDREWNADMPHGDPPDSFPKMLLTLFGFPVAEDGPARVRAPVLTWGLAISFLVAFALMHAAGFERSINEFGFLPSDPFRHGGLTLLASFFMHAGIMHLVGNTWFLLLTGDACEQLLGRVRFVLLIALGVAAADLAHFLFGGSAQIPSIGASGGISALIAYYALSLPHVKLVFCFRFYAVYPVWFRLSAAWAAVIWVALQVIGSIFLARDGIAYAAHLGGAVGGLLFWGIEKARTHPGPPP